MAAVRCSFLLRFVHISLPLVPTAAGRRRRVFAARHRSVRTDDLGVVMVAADIVSTARQVRVLSRLFLILQQLGELLLQLAVVVVVSGLFQLCESIRKRKRERISCARRLWKGAGGLLVATKLLLYFFDNFFELFCVCKFFRSRSSRSFAFWMASAPRMIAFEDVRTAFVCHSGWRRKPSM